MRGSVLKRGDSWCVVIELARDPETGRRRQRWHSGYRTKKEAERARVDLLSKVDSASYVEKSQQTVAEFVSDWLATIEATVRDATLYSYRRNLSLHVVPYIGAARLATVDAGTLNALYARLLIDGRRDRRGGLSPRTVRYVHTILHRAMKDAVRWGRLARNPVDAADPPRAATAQREMQTWRAHDLRRFLAASRTSDDRHYAAWLLLATTGMRRGEALGLRWGDVDLDAGRASIQSTVIAVKHEIRFGTPKTAKGRRQVALDAATVATLRDHRRQQLEQRMMMGAGWRDFDLVFTTVTGEPVHPERFSREFDRRVERWTLPRIRLHDLRHGWATMALEAGVHPKVVSERLGHAGIAITLDTYSHVSPAMASDAAEMVAALVFGEGGG